MASFCVVCQVKTDGRKRNGVKACQPCKSFFLAHCDNVEQLKCRTGKENCTASDISIKTSTFVINNGNIWRFSCPRCRYRKCLKSGMKNGRAEKLAERQLCLYSPTTIFSLSDSNNTQIEVNLNSMGQGFNHLFTQFDKNLPGRVRICFSKDDILACQLDNFTKMAQWQAQFLHQIPGYSELSLQERSKVFATGYHYISFLFCILFNTNMGMATPNFEILASVFPTFATFVVENEKLTYFLRNNISPDLIETAFMVVYTFFGENQSGTIMIGANKAFQAYLVNKFNGNVVKAIERFESLTDCSKFLIENCRIRLNVHIMESSNFYKNQLLEEMTIILRDALMRNK